MPASNSMPGRASSEGSTLLEIALVFARLGATSFGGPAAHVALFREEFVVRRRWVDERRFLDLLSAANLIPGPNSTELAIHLGRERRGLAGLVVAGLSFVLPAVAITAALAWCYVRYGSVPDVRDTLNGIQAVIVAVVIHAIVGLARTAARTIRLAALGVAALTATWFGVNELIVLFSAGVLAVATSFVGDSHETRARAVVPLPPAWITALPPLAASAAGSATPLGVFVSFAKIGSVLFGSGYVLLAFLRAEFVERLGLLSEAQLVDAVAAGQITPGPLFSTATFVGYLLCGPWGALAATVGIFLPAFVFVALTGPILDAHSSSRVLRGFLEGVSVASLALMVAVTIDLGRVTLVDPSSGLLAVGSWIALWRFRVSPTWLILLGAVAGYALRLGP